MKKIFNALISNILIFISIGISFYILFLLTINVSRGFDITDESFYILWAQFPEVVIASVTSFGFYTGLIHFISGENLALFRLTGILILLLASFFFAKELYQYVLNITKTKPSRKELVLFIIPITTASLAYYRYWLITPSYNWLNLVGILLFIAAKLE